MLKTIFKLFKFDNKKNIDNKTKKMQRYITSLVTNKEAENIENIANTENIENIAKNIETSKEFDTNSKTKQLILNLTSISLKISPKLGVTCIEYTKDILTVIIYSMIDINDNIIAKFIIDNKYVGYVDTSGILYIVK